MYNIIFSIILIILILLFSCSLSIFIFDIYVKYKINFFGQFIERDDIKKINQRYQFLKSSLFLNSSSFQNFKEEALNFYEDLYEPNKILFENKVNFSSDFSRTYNFFKWKIIIKELKSISQMLETNHIYSEKQNYLLNKAYDYYNSSNSVFLNLRKMIEIIIEDFKEKGIKIPEIHKQTLKKINRNIKILENENSFLQNSFKKKLLKILEEIKFLVKILNIYLVNITNLNFIKHQYEIIEKDLENSKLEIIGVYSNLQMISFSIKGELFNLNLDFQNDSNQDLSDQFKVILFKIEEFYNLYSNEIRFKKFVFKYLQKITYIPREIDIRNSLIINELKLNNVDDYEIKIKNLKIIDRKIVKKFNEIENMKALDLIKYKNFSIILQEFFELFKQYLIFTNNLSLEINTINKTKEDMNLKLSQINIDLLDCESKLRLLPEILQIQYNVVFENHSHKANEYTQKYHQKANLTNKSDYLIVSYFSDTIISLKVKIYSELFLVKFAEQAIIILNKYRNNSKTFSTYMTKIEEGFLIGEISSTLRLILKVLELYNIRE